MLIVNDKATLVYKSTSTALNHRAFTLKKRKKKKKKFAVVMNEKSTMCWGCS